MELESTCHVLGARSGSAGQRPRDALSLLHTSQGLHEEAAQEDRKK